jgi:hypothetical protein
VRDVVVVNLAFQRVVRGVLSAVHVLYELFEDILHAMFRSRDSLCVALLGLAAASIVHPQTLQHAAASRQLLVRLALRAGAGWSDSLRVRADTQR